MGERGKGGGSRRRGREERVRRGPRKEGGWEVRGPPVLRLGGGMMRRRGARREGRIRGDGEIG